ncbi:pseudouridine-5'-phosphate glycosidase [Ureaplasma sp. ES3154-GEN]|uniref:pseudouridine-5'-phosphate glycosidase n=1 Tax=Ureaplasma sp. ES3154-GEN TaxID=2984844 RepID=UPI0021E8B1C0|nr:pseudouridine-5'-phosphate glycosidase [Ureaplasma sp. ES3154-GEN]MCV3743396.1 pseudouridine-5'-phosphate glycosidase [Ureaplasma sp. ES3154-GEN]
MKIQILDEIKNALANNQAVVSLESTIISHGMPYPQNIAMAKECERIIREQNAIPATIAIIKGVIKVGLSNEDLEYLATAKDVYKTSTRDLGYVLANKLTGATTVATTSLISQHVGIKVFATGGIGGVHRNAQETFDISNDLEVIAKTPILVVCAGPKAILDLPLTLEYLETKGVEVLGYQTPKLPAFYSATSDLDVTYRINSVTEVADLMHAKWNLDQSGIILANPIPKAYSIPNEVINQYINRALQKAVDLKITGKDTTPFLLKEITEQTNSQSLEANIQLVYNNAKVAALVAVAYTKKSEK